MARALTSFAFLLIPLAVAWASPASVGSLQGEVTLSRGGVLIPSEKVAEGAILEPFDTVTTGPSGRAEIRFGGAQGPGATVRLEAGTSVYVEFSPGVDPKDSPVVVTFLAGKITVLEPSPFPLEVRTELVVISGAQPGFRLVGVDEGDVLVSSRGAPVACRVGDRTVLADADSAVEVTAAGAVRTLPSNPATLATLEASWADQRRQSFRNQVARSFRTVAAGYQRQLGQFQRAWARYQKDAQDGGTGLLAATTNLRHAALPLDRTLPALRVLRRFLDEGVLSPTVELTRGYPAKDFFRQVSLDETPWFGRLVEARGLFRVAFDRNGGTFPIGREGWAITWDSDYFH